jgi:hypothetical protein
MSSNFEEDVELPKVPKLVIPYPDVLPENPFDIAMLIDNVVYQLYNVEGEQAAQLLSQPTFVQFKPGTAKIGWKYNPETKEFSRPVYDPETDKFIY